MEIFGTYFQRNKMENEEKKNEQEQKEENKKTYFQKYCEDNPESVECRIYED